MSSRSIHGENKKKKVTYISSRFIYICDMIKGNESDVGNIDFELQAKRGQILMFYIVFEFKELFISLQPDV